MRRLDDRLGLAVRRVGLSGRSLVTYARDHVTVRTPSRPDLRDGNTLDLEARPEPEDLAGWLERFDGTVGVLGARHRQLRWEEPSAPDASSTGPEPDPALLQAATRLGLELSAVTVLLLDELHPPEREPSADLVPVEAPSAVPGGAVDRRWHAATVLYRYAVGDSPDAWREYDADMTEWSADVQRELAAAGRCQVWVAMRHGGPVARLTLVHDRQGLAVVEDVVTHPVHRGIGIASRLTYRAIVRHLEVAPGSRVGLATEPASAAERLARRLGFRPHATVWTALRPDPRARQRA